jgi:DNA-binding response OmpR family regulator
MIDPNETKDNMQNLSEPIKLLLVDDDSKFCRLISEYLGQFGYDINAVHTGVEALESLKHHSYQAVVLDVMLPEMDGFRVLQEVRTRSTVPILMLTALGEETDRIIGLEFGADDYVPKTSSPRELLARLRSVLRRSQATFETAKVSGSHLVVGDLEINIDARELKIQTELVALTPVEFDILVVLAHARGRIKTREDLINDIRDRHYDVFDRSIDVHISSIRKKLRDDPKDPKYIRTVRSAGYMLI